MIINSNEFLIFTIHKPPTFVKKIRMRNLSRKSLRRLIRICAQTDISVKANHDNQNSRVKYVALIKRTPGYKHYALDRKSVV